MPITAIFQQITSISSTKGCQLFACIEQVASLEKALKKDPDGLCDATIDDFIHSLSRLPPNRYHRALHELDLHSLVALEKFLISVLTLYLQKKITAGQQSELIAALWKWDFQRSSNDLVTELGQLFGVCKSLDLQNLETLLELLKTGPLWSHHLIKSKIDSRSRDKGQCKREFFFIQKWLRQEELALCPKALCPDFSEISKKQAQQLKIPLRVDFSYKQHYKDQQIADQIQRLCLLPQEKVELSLCLDGLSNVGEQTLQALDNCSNLYQLSLNDCISRDSALDRWLSVKNLHLLDLRLHRAQCASECFTHLGISKKSLKNLELDQTQINDKSIHILAKTPMQALTSLSLRGCRQLTSMSMPKLSRLFPSLEKLDLSKSQVRLDASLARYFPPNLTHLHLAWLRGTHYEFMQALLAHLPNLSHIHLAHCSDFDKKAIASLLDAKIKRPLSAIDLSYCHQINTCSIEKLLIESDLSQLKFLGLHSHYLPRSLLEKIDSLSLHALSIDFTPHMSFFKRSQKSLEQLYLRKTEFLCFEDHDTFFQETPLKRLQIEGLKTLTIEAQMVLSQCARLEHLHLSGSEQGVLTVEEQLESLSQLKKLRSLELSLMSGIGLQGLEKLIRGLKNLSCLTLGPMKDLTGKQILQLKKRVPHLKINTYGLRLK